MEILRANQINLKEAAKKLRLNQLVAFPTETVYGIGANAQDDDAVLSIYQAKGRPSNNPLIVHITSLAQAKQFGQFNDTSLKLAEKFWPGPMSLIVPLKEGHGLSKHITAGGTTVALRMPAHPIARTLLTEASIPVAAPSANKSGKISPTLASHVADDFADDDLTILDGGACLVGLESSVILAKADGDIEILRPGSIGADEIYAAINDIDQVENSELALSENDQIMSPGTLSSHYAPNSHIRMDATKLESDEILLNFGAQKIVDFQHQNEFDLSAKGDLKEAGKNLFAMLHQLDELAEAENLKIAVAPIPNEGIGIAVNDRLRRACAPKE